jgi:signal transduction histidine kinase
VGATSIGDFGAYLTVLSRWWTGDGLGVLIVGGTIIAWLTDTSWPVRPRHPGMEIAVGMVGLGLVTWAVFWRWQPALAFLTLPIVGWASFRFGARGATTAGLVVVTMAQWATATSHGLFAIVAGANHSLALWLLQAFLGIVIVMGLLLATQVAELGHTQDALHSAELAEREARLATERLLAAERARLARELHDAVGHAVSVMVLQAGAARMTMREGEETSQTIRSIEETGREALTELDRLLGLIESAGRSCDGDRRPALGLEHLDRLLENVRATGLEVTLTVPNGLPKCSSALDHSAYRIIQEALTNAVKHAGASRVEVTVSCPTGDLLEIGVADNGATHPGDTAQVAAGGGRGLIGMRERVASFGGDLHAGPSPSGGWRVEVSLPLNE